MCVDVCVCVYVFIQDPDPDPDPDPESDPKLCEKSDPDPDTDPKKIIPDPQHWSWQFKILVLQFFVNVNKCAKYFLNLKRCCPGGGQAQMVLPNRNQRSKRHNWLT
jgi:hypothetical protein